MRSGFSFLNFCGHFSLTLFQNVLQCPGARPVLERSFNYSFMTYVKISVKADNSHICDLEKGRKCYYTQERYSFRWWVWFERLGFWQRGSLGLAQARRCRSWDHHVGREVGMATRDGWSSVSDVNQVWKWGDVTWKAGFLTEFKKIKRRGNNGPPPLPITAIWRGGSAPSRWCRATVPAPPPSCCSAARASLPHPAAVWMFSISECLSCPFNSLFQY